MDQLPKHQRDRLDALLAELATLPIPERIAESARLRSPLPLDDSGKKRMRFALGGAYAAEKVMYYLQALRAINQQREILNREIAEKVWRERVFTDRGDPTGATQARVEQIVQSGLLEVILHTFAVYAWRIAVLLPIAARAAGARVSTPDRAVLDSYEPLRHHFEHLEQRLPGGKYAAEFVTESMDESAWSIRSSFQVDESGRFVIDGKVVDVTTRGLHEIETAIQNTWDAISIKTLEEVSLRFALNSEDIPDRTDVQQSLLFSAAKPSESIQERSDDDGERAVEQEPNQ